MREFLGVLLAWAMTVWLLVLAIGWAYVLAPENAGALR